MRNLLKIFIFLLPILAVAQNNDTRLLSRLLTTKFINPDVSSWKNSNSNVISKVKFENGDFIRRGDLTPDRYKNIFEWADSLSINHGFLTFEVQFYPLTPQNSINSAIDMVQKTFQSLMDITGKVLIFCLLLEVQNNLLARLILFGDLIISNKLPKVVRQKQIKLH